MRKFDEFDIPFVGLSLGIHHYEFKLGNAFFDQFDDSEIKTGSFDVKVKLEKQSSMLILDFELKGIVNTLCDRCGDKLDFPVEYSDEIIFKFGGQQADSESIVVISPNEHKINIASLLEEFANLSLPLKRKHEDGKCNAEALKILEQINKRTPTEIDPRWEELKKLKKD